MRRAQNVDGCYCRSASSLSKSAVTLSSLPTFQSSTKIKTKVKSRSKIFVDSGLKILRSGAKGRELVLQG